MTAEAYFTNIILLGIGLVITWLPLQWFIVSAATGPSRDRNLEIEMILIIVMDCIGASK